MHYPRLATCLALLLTACNRTNPYGSTHQSHLDKNWYAPTKAALTAQVKNLYLSTITTLGTLPSFSSAQQVRALVVPHASYTYSGTIAASAYARVTNPNTIKRIIILAPSHHQSFVGATTLPADSYTTPLGTLPLDSTAIQSLTATGQVIANAAPFANEHSLEIQLPLIQHRFKKASIIPLLIGSLTPDTTTDLAHTLLTYIDEHTLVVISSDFTHYGKSFNYRPFTQQVHQNISTLDTAAVNALRGNSVDQWRSFLSYTGATICGANPLRILQALQEQQAWGHTFLEQIAYDTSGRQCNTTSHSVSYLALAVRTLSINDQESEALLLRARAALTAITTKGYHHSQLPIAARGIAHQPLGLFATLRTIMPSGKRRLRGCIGTLTTDKKLFESIDLLTTQAALHDPRFMAVSPDELESIRLSLSIITPSRPIKSSHQIRLGIHGTILECQDRKAVFLPEVATQQRWSTETMLNNLCLKAGLPSNAWRRPDCQLSVFESIKMSES